MVTRRRLQRGDGDSHVAVTAPPPSPADVSLPADAPATRRSRGSPADQLVGADLADPVEGEMLVEPVAEGEGTVTVTVPNHASFAVAPMKGFGAAGTQNPCSPSGDKSTAPRAVGGRD